MKSAELENVLATLWTAHLHLAGKTGHVETVNRDATGQYGLCSVYQDGQKRPVFGGVITGAIREVCRRLDKQLGRDECEEVAEAPERSAVTRK